MRDEPVVIGEHSSLQQIFRLLRKVAPTNGTVLVTGETGTGKELIVRTVHNLSQRSKGPFVPVNCGALPKDLIESELFGYVQGAFTGATRERQGRFEAASGGTLFLDEIGEMDITLQVKILRVLQEREVTRLGSSQIRKVDVRVVAATNRDLEREVEQGRFREDLYYRLNVVPVHLPPLRERGEDILELARHFLHAYSEINATPELALSPEAARMLLAYPWPGNVRELENFMQRLSIMADGPFILPSDLPDKIVHTLERAARDRSARDARDDAPLRQEGPAPHSARATAFRDEVYPDRPVSVLDERQVLFGLTDEELAHAQTPREPEDGAAYAWPSLATLEALGLNMKDFLTEVEERLIDEALSSANGLHLPAAKRLGIKRTTLIEKLRRKGKQ